MCTTTWGWKGEGRRGWGAPNTPFPSCLERQLESTYSSVRVYTHSHTCTYGNARARIHTHTHTESRVLPRLRHKRESSRPEGELARSVRLKPANVSTASAICACGFARRRSQTATGNERSCTMTSTSAFFTASAAGRRRSALLFRRQGNNVY